MQAILAVKSKFEINKKIKFINWTFQTRFLENEVQINRGLIYQKPAQFLPADMGEQLPLSQDLYYLGCTYYNFDLT